MAKEAEALQFEAEREELGNANAHLAVLRQQYDRVSALLRNELPPAEARALAVEIESRRGSVPPPQN